MQLKRAALILAITSSLTMAAMAAPNWKTLTDAPRNTDGAGLDKNRPIHLRHSGGDLCLEIQNDNWMLNTAGQMGADREFFNEKTGGRMGVWAGDSLAGKEPRALVTDWVKSIKSLTGGNWSEPKLTNIAGIPVVQATGVDVYGNYFYRVVAFTKFGVNYAVAIRCDYSDRWSRQLDNDITAFVTGSHLTTRAFHKNTNFR